MHLYNSNPDPCDMRAPFTTTLHLLPQELCPCLGSTFGHVNWICALIDTMPQHLCIIDRNQNWNKSILGFSLWYLLLFVYLTPRWNQVVMNVFFFYFAKVNRHISTLAKLPKIHSKAIYTKTFSGQMWRTRTAGMVVNWQQPHCDITTTNSDISNASWKSVLSQLVVKGHHSRF